jgi:short-subunit dehydrogenase
VARREDRLRLLATALGPDHEILASDLAKEDELELLAHRLEALPDLQLLVNNAGFGTKGLFWHTDFGRQVEMHRLHVLAPLRLTRAVLPVMVKRNQGAVINVSSVAGFFRSRGNASYCATKGWLNDFTEALYLELKAVRSKVKVQALCPGFTYTEFHDAMGVSRGPIPKSMWMSADFVVQKSLRGLERGKLFVIPGWRYKLLVALGTRLPTRLKLALQGASPHTKGRT